MEQHRLEVASEIYAEGDLRSSQAENGFSVTHFGFCYPNDHEMEVDRQHGVDEEGDLILSRRKRNEIKIMHRKATNLTLVGLQIWRGAFVLADFLIYHRKQLAKKRLFELGAGVGLTSIAAAVYAQKDITCTDINLGGILELIKTNIEMNRQLFANGVNVHVMELDFKDKQWPMELCDAIRDADVIFTADVIYDNDITDYFIETLVRILNPNDLNRTKTKEIFIALEKRYVFTMADLDVVAPCYEYFMQRIQEMQSADGRIKLDIVNIDFPQYFIYERSKDLTIMKFSIC